MQTIVLSSERQRPWVVIRSLAMAIILVLATGCATVSYGGPRLSGPVGDDLFEDGSAVVRLGHATDGDTATFIVGNETYATRFLAVNTPELTDQIYGVEPWARAAQQFTREQLEGASEIVLELDTESDTFDRYDRLLAWVWVDGELLNYKLVKEGYAWVMYLYGDYKYNGLMIQTESETRATGIRIFGEDDPNYDYEKVLVEHTTQTVRSEELGKRVRVPGVVTARIGNNAFVQQDGHGVYIYAAQKRWQHLVVGNEVSVTGTLSEYNSLLEITNVEEVMLINESGASVAPLVTELRDINETLEGILVRVNNVTIVGVEPRSGRGYNVAIAQDGVEGVIRVDQYLLPYIEQEAFVAGVVVDIVAPVGQYLDAYQLMLTSIDHIELQE